MVKILKQDKTSITIDVSDDPTWLRTPRQRGKEEKKEKTVPKR